MNAFKARVDPSLVRSQIEHVKSTLGDFISWDTNKMIGFLESELDGGKDIFQAELVQLMQCFKNDMRFKEQRHD